jgi:hypothetical protein
MITWYERPISGWDTLSIFICLKDIILSFEPCIYRMWGTDFRMTRLRTSFFDFQTLWHLMHHVFSGCIELISGWQALLSVKRHLLSITSCITSHICRMWGNNFRPTCLQTSSLNFKTSSPQEQLSYELLQSGLLLPHITFYFPISLLPETEKHSHNQCIIMTQTLAECFGMLQLQQWLAKWTTIAYQACRNNYVEIFN